MYTHIYNDAGVDNKVLIMEVLPTCCHPSNTQLLLEPFTDFLSFSLLPLLSLKYVSDLAIPAPVFTSSMQSSCIMLCDTLSRSTITILCICQYMFVCESAQHCAYVFRSVLQIVRRRLYASLASTHIASALTCDYTFNMLGGGVMVTGC